jgi:tetratricopeptide (TPR) repeat protein
MPSLDVLLTSSTLLVLAAVVAIVVALVLVRSTLGARRDAEARLDIAGRLGQVVAPLETREPVGSAESDGLEPYRWALSVREESLGPDHPDVATACHILGAMYMERERFAEAEPLLHRALQIRTRSFGPSHSDVAQTVDDLATLYRAQGRRIEADSLLETVLAAQSPAPPSTESEVAKRPIAPAPQAPPPEVAPPAQVAPSAQVAPKAIEGPAVSAPQPQRVGREPTKPSVTAPRPVPAKSDHPDGEELTRVLREIAGLRGVDAAPASAQELYRRALAMMEATGATDRPELRTALRELGRLYYRQGAFAEAEPLLERALALARRANDAAEVAEISDDLAWLRFSLRSLPER